MEARPVPRNIDAPNRMPEYAISFVGTFYSTMFLLHMPTVSLICAGAAVYFIYKYTLDKPEGLMFRMIYRHMQIGKFRPSPRFVKRFELN
ncbi:MAG TPA: hypothetical protein VHP58_02915 [Alphaproteobacteria bacterium]|nr:hypothetical protein [Alphaproteobacteria bacterium]